jgi:SAM-dependent methyltransferase
MSYTIGEHNAERQQLLAQCLNPLTRPVLDRIPPASIHRILDLGCGQGNTTRLLADHFPHASALGLEYDPALVAHACLHSAEPSRILFEQGDAQCLLYPDASFDLTFARYLLLHLPDPLAAIREMLRVTRPGGFVIAFEPDCCVDFSYPPNPSLERMTYLWNKLFPNPLMGRQLIHLFRSAGAGCLSAGAAMGMDHETGIYQRLYRISAEAVGPAIAAKGLMTSDEYGTLIAGLRQLEADNLSTCFKFPDIWVIASV